MRNFSSKYSKETTEVSEKIRRQQIFVYKIIHDLKHPTQAVNDSLENIIKEMDQNNQFSKKLFKRQ